MTFLRDDPTLWTIHPPISPHFHNVWVKKSPSSTIFSAQKALNKEERHFLGIKKFLRGVFLVFEESPTLQD